MEYWTIALSIMIGVLSINYLFKTFNYFKRHNVIHVPPVPIFGIMIPLIFRQISLDEFTQKLYYFKPDAKYYGFYTFTEPAILLRDLDLIKEVFIKSFDVFPNRRGFSTVDHPFFKKGLFSLQGQRWKKMRTMLSPAFTSSKMKTMFTLTSECAVNFANVLSALPSDKRDINMRDAFIKYTTDVIATCAFGIKIDSMNDPANKFYVYGKEASNFQGLRGLKFTLCSSIPWLMRVIGLKVLSDDLENFFKNTIKNTIDNRVTKNITRPDMIQLMMDIRDKHEAEEELSIENMTAQAFSFFLGGLETSSLAMSFITQEIAANPDIQSKLQQEIDKALEDSNGEVTYETINHLEYLDAVINETLRFYPPLVTLERICEKDYILPPALPTEKPFTLKKGMSVIIPVYSLHHDEKYYDDPDKFCPERFLNNNAYHNSPCFTPFGLGPRMCIAYRFGTLVIKVLLFHLLSRCELTPCAKTILPIKISKVSSISILPEGGFWLKVQRRNDMHPTIG